MKPDLLFPGVTRCTQKPDIIYSMIFRNQFANGTVSGKIVVEFLPAQATVRPFLHTAALCRVVVQEENVVF